LHVQYSRNHFSGQLITISSFATSNTEPNRPEAGKPNPKQRARGVEAKPAALRPFQDRELVTAGKNLDLPRCPSPDPESEVGKHGKKQRGKPGAGRLTRVLDKINNFSFDDILGRHNSSSASLRT
jgi:hypothetical protein